MVSRPLISMSKQRNMRTVDTSCIVVADWSRLKRLTPQDKIQYPTIDMAINLLLPPFTKIDRRQPIMDNYTDIQNYIDNYMLGSPYIQCLLLQKLPRILKTY